MTAIRKLAAIVFADIAGYSAMMQRDEQHALRVLHHFRKDIDRLVPAFKGEIIQYYGDGALLIFNSALEALQCAVRLQNSVRNEPAVPVRIGIHQGDVIMEGGNIFGDNVNVAARIESMSIPGAILLSAKVESELHNQPDIILKSIGQYDFKNIATPIEVFAYAGEGFTVPKRSDITGKFRVQNEEKSIAVLAFKNQSSDQEQEYIGEGIAEEIIFGLSKLENINVAGRRSSFSFKNSDATLATIADQLHVNHILEGTVRKSGNRIRVNVQLVDVSNGFQIWTERFDRELEDIFFIQDEIADQVVQKMKLTLLGQEKSQAIIQRKTDNLQAYDLYLRGRSYLDKRTDIELALSCFQKAIEVDPDFAAAHTSVAYAYFYKIVFANYAPTEGWPKAASAIQKALELDDSFAEAMTMQGLVDFYYHHHPEEARAAYERALLLQPKFADTYRVKAYFHIMMHEPNQAIADVQKCYELDPLSFNNRFSLGDIYYRSRRFSDAVAVFEEMTHMYPQVVNVQIMLGTLYHLQDQPQKARAMLDPINAKSITLDLYGNDRFVVAARLGDRSVVDRRLQDMIRQREHKWISPTLIAILYLSLGEQEHGITSLQQAVKENDPALFMFSVLPL